MVGPILVPVVKFLIAHVHVVHPFNGFLLDLGGDELLLKGVLEFGPCSVIVWIGC